MWFYKQVRIYFTAAQILREQIDLIPLNKPQ